MTERRVTHATFVIERDFEARPERVFQAFADPAIKARWFASPPEWENVETSMDFRVGGQDRQVDRSGPADATVTFASRYLDIVSNERIVFAYDIHMNDVTVSCSLTTVELRPEGGGTRLTYTEQGAYLDGYDEPGQREQGTGGMLDQLGQALEEAAGV